MDFRKSKKTRLQRKVLCAIYVSLLYHIWLNRNTCLWKGYVKTSMQVLSSIRLTIRDRVEALCPKVSDSRIRGWVRDVDYDR
ncbi:unnamed protein product [Amaranthus hypochondriacus]